MAGNRKLIFLVVVAILLGVGAAGFMFMRGSSKSTANTDNTPTSTPFVEEPMPTEAPMVNKSDLKVKILNGSGVVGEAGKVQKILEGADFTVDSTGNADAYDHKTTEIQAKSSVSTEITDELTDLLKVDYTPEVTSLADDEDVDIIIVVGARKNAPTAAAKPTSSETPINTKPTTSATATPTGATTPSPTPTKVP